MTPAEMARLITRLEREHRDFVSAAVYERDMKEIRDDIKEIKDSLRWMLRGVVSLFFVVLVQLVISLATQGPL